MSPSHAPGAIIVEKDAPANRKGHPNENLARELLELFTLGVAHYTESDVKETARTLTGWTVGDEVYVKFDTLDFSPALSSGAGTAIFGVPSGPVIIGPGHSFLLYLWHPAVVTAPQWEIEMAWWEDKS